ncbi:TonB-dependent siderophore receptor, partial [Acinetobacter baumannii]
HNSRLLYYYGYPKADGSGVSLTPWGGQEHQEQHAVDFNLEGTYKLFNQEHEATLGYNYVRSRQHDKQSTGTINDSNVINSTTTNWASWTPQSITWS